MINRYEHTYSSFLVFLVLRLETICEAIIAIHLCDIVLFHVGSYKNLFLYSILLTTVFRVSHWLSLYHAISNIKDLTSPGKI